MNTPDVLYISLHQWPLYPGTGSAEEIGEGLGRGTTLNIPLARRNEGRRLPSCVRRAHRARVRGLLAKLAAWFRPVMAPIVPTR